MSTSEPFDQQTEQNIFKNETNIRGQTLTIAQFNSITVCMKLESFSKNLCMDYNHPSGIRGKFLY